MLKDIKIVVYGSLPCEAESFVINGVVGSKSDFGCNSDVGSFDYEYGEWDDENWACADNQFVPDDKPQDGVLEKYSITLDEFREVQDRLKVEFNIGGCEWCV